MKKVLWIIALLILGLIIGYLIIFGSSNFDKMEKSNPQESKTKRIETPVNDENEEKKIPVKVNAVVSTMFTAKLKTVGTTIAKHDYTLSAKMNGEITYLKADIGTVVKKGDVLAKIDPEMAQANYNQAAANYNLAQKTYSRQKKLAAKKLVSTQQLDSSETQYRVAKATLSLAKINLKNSKVISPIDGVIAEEYTKLHTFTAAGTPVTRIVNTSKIQLQVGVSERNIVKIKNGNKAYIKISSYPAEVFPGIVINVGLQAESKTKTFPIKVEFDNADAKIKGGMIADISILLNTYEDAIVIPFHLLQQTSKGYYCYIVENGKAIRRDLVVGNVQDDVARIISGLNVGDQLITEGHKYVNDQMSVIIKQ